MPLKLEIVSPERMVYNDEVDMVIVPGRNGQLGILPHHTPLISSLGVGELRIKKGGTEESMLISGGFVEVRPDKVIVMADLAEHSDEIDEAKAVEARKRAESELEQSRDPVDIARVRAALQTALMRDADRHAATLAGLMQPCDQCGSRFAQLPVRIEIVRASGPIGLPGDPAGTSSNFSKGYAFCSSDHAYAWARERRYMLCNAAPTPFEEGMQPFLPS